MKINTREKIEMELNFTEKEEKYIWWVKEVLTTLLLPRLKPKDEESIYKMSVAGREYDYKQIEKMIIFLDDLYFGNIWELIKEKKETGIKE